MTEVVGYFFNLKKKKSLLSISTEGNRFLAVLSVENLHSKVQTPKKTHLCPRKDWCNICANRVWITSLAWLSLAWHWGSVTFLELPEGFGLLRSSVQKRAPVLCIDGLQRPLLLLHLTEPNAYFSYYWLLNLKQTKNFYVENQREREMGVFFPSFMFLQLE